MSRTHVNVRHSNGASGVVHVSQLAADVQDASTVYSSGRRIVAKIASFDDARMQVELTVRALLYEQYKARHKVGDEVEGRVVRATRTHVYVAHPNGALGAVFARNLAHGGVADASTNVVVGAKLTAKIIEFKDEQLQVELSVKALLPPPVPPYEAFKTATKEGDPVTGVVSGFNDHFAYVKLARGVDGSIHVTQLSSTRVGKPADVLAKGQEVRAFVVRFDDQRKKVELSLRPTLAAPARPAPAHVPAAPPPHAAAARPVTVPRTPPPPRPRSVVVEAESEEAAIAEGCRQLNASPSSVVHKTLQHAEPKRLLRAARPARVQITRR